MKATLILLAAAAASANGACTTCCLYKKHTTDASKYCDDAVLSSAQEARVCCKSGETCCKYAAFAASKATCCTDKTHTCTSEVCVPKTVTVQPTPAPTVRKSILSNAQSTATAAPVMEGFAGASCRDNCGKKNRVTAPLVNNQLNMFNYQYSNAWPAANFATAPAAQAAAGRRQATANQFATQFQFAYPTTTAATNTNFYFPTAAPAARGEAAATTSFQQFPQYVNYQAPQCSCDSECTRYNDCCSDYSYYCPRGGSSSSARPTTNVATTSDTCDFAAVRAGAYAALAKANQAALFLQSKSTQEYDIEMSFEGDVEVRAAMLSANHATKASYASKGALQAVKSAKAAAKAANQARDNALLPTLFAKSSVVQIECKLAQANTQMAMDLAARVEPFVESMLKPAASRRRLLANDKDDDAMDALLEKAETYETLATKWSDKASVYGAVTALLERAEAQWKYISAAGAKATELEKTSGVKGDNKDASAAKTHQTKACELVQDIAKGDTTKFTDTANDDEEYELSVKSTYSAIIDLLKSAQSASETLTEDARDAFYKAEASFHMIQSVYITVHRILTDTEYRQGNLNKKYSSYTDTQLAKDEPTAEATWNSYPVIETASDEAFTEKLGTTEGCAFTDVTITEVANTGCFPSAEGKVGRYIPCSNLPYIGSGFTVATSTACQEEDADYTATFTLGSSSSARDPLADADNTFAKTRVWAVSKDGTEINQGSDDVDYGLYRPYRIAVDGLTTLVSKFGDSADTTYDAFLAYSEGKAFDKIKEAVDDIEDVTVTSRAPTASPTVTTTTR
jgi:hypothetical protein